MAEGSVTPTPTVPERKILERLYSDVLHWRPTKGASEEAYWHLRHWCEQNDYNIGEVLNALVPVIAYYALNFTDDTGTVDKYGKPVLSINLTAGKIEIPRTSGRTGRRPTHSMYESRVRK